MQTGCASSGLNVGILANYQRLKICSFLVNENLPEVRLYPAFLPHLGLPWGCITELAQSGALGTN